MMSRRVPPARNNLAPSNHGDVILEQWRIGDAVKISAFHVTSLTEAIIVVPATITPAAAQAAVLRKLAFLRARSRL